MIYSREMASKRIMMTLRYLTWLSSASQKISVSSAYWKWVTSGLEAWCFATLNSLINPLPLAVFNILFRPSIAKMKRKDDRGSPSLNPLWEGKKLAGEPLINMEILIVPIQNLIQLIHFFQSPFYEGSPTLSPSSHSHMLSQCLTCT